MQQLTRLSSRPAMRVVLPLACAVPASLACLKLASHPFVWISVVWTVACLLVMIGSRSTRIKAVFFNLAFVPAALGGLEIYATVVGSDIDNSVRLYPTHYRVRDDVLGAAPVKGASGRSRLLLGREVVYDVTYSIGADGLRVAPPDRGTDLAGCILFFGDSFTFGEGLNDDETLPYRVGALTRGAYRVYNLGFHGYGPQQMLAALEHGLVDQVVRCAPTHAIYGALPDHAARATGLHAYGRHSVRYRLNPDGSATADGHFDDEPAPRPSLLAAELSWQLSKSALYRRLTSRMRRVTDEDIRLFVAIIKQAEGLVRQKFPGCEFHVLLWRWRDDVPTYDKMLSRLRQAGIRVLLVSEILPGYLRNPGQYEIPHDRHPNPRANEILAQYVVQEILGAQETPDAAGTR